MWMTNELLPKIWVFGANLDEVHHPQSWRGHMRSFSEISHFSTEQATCAHMIFLPNPSSQVEHKRHLVLRTKKKTPPKLGIICERYWLLNLPPTFGQHMGTTSQNKQCQPNKNFYMLGIWGFYMLFLPTWLWAPPSTKKFLPSM